MPESSSNVRGSTSHSKSSSSSSNPVVAYLSKQKSPHPYSSVSLSPCRQYAVTACKDTLQIIKVGATGLRPVKTVLTAPYFQQHDTASTKLNHRIGQPDTGLLNLRDFALGGGGGGAPQQQPQQQQQAANSMMNVVITDVAWSSGISTKKKKHESDEDEDEEGWQKVETTNDDDIKQQRLRSSLIAAAGSNGMIVIWSAETLLGLNNPAAATAAAANGPPSTQAPDAVLSQHVRQVNRLAWHPSKHGLLLSASQDGTVLLWERRETDVSPVQNDEPEKKIRLKGFFGGFSSTAAPFQQQRSSFQWHCRSTFAPKSEAVRDIRWSPFYEDLFALVTMTGCLIVYNQFIAARPMIKLTAHSGDASTLDWHPTRPNVVATGGANDRSVKVWDLEGDLSMNYNNIKDDSNVERNSNTATSSGTNESTTGMGCDAYGMSATIGPTSMFPMSYATRTMSSMSSGGLAGSSRHRGGSKIMLHVLSISASVTRLRWRPPANEKFVLENEDRHDSMMAVATAPIKGASAGGSGVLALWSYNRPFMPLSVVEGHKEGAVTDFDWLDTPQQRQHQRLDASGRHGGRNMAHLSSAQEGSTSRLPGSASHEVDSILYDNTESDDAVDEPIGIWQHVLSVGRDGRCLVQSFARGDRPISRVPPSCFAMANLSPFQKGYGSLQLFSVCQHVPSGADSDFLLTGLRKDSVTANAPGIFREIPFESSPGHTVKNLTFPVGWRAGHRLPDAAPGIVFNVIDGGDLDEESNPVDDDGRQAIVVAPEVVHLSRFASRYRLYPDDDCPSRVALCLHNADVAESLSQSSLAHMWRMVASMLESTGLDGLPDTNSQQPQNVTQFVILPTIKALLEERADAGDVQTCVALCEVLEVVRPDQTIRIPELEIELVREWYLSYIDLLRDMCLFSSATYLIRSCKDSYIGALNQQSTTIHESCPHCGKALLLEDGPAARDQDSTFARRSCKSCRRRVGLCFLCHEPVKGIYVCCPGCGHGGHLDHALQWFGGLSGGSVREVCPTGCGHRCNMLKELSAFPKTESFHEFQFDSSGHDSFYE